MPVKVSTSRGDTLIEVAFSIAVFALVSLLSITIMNTGITMAETSLENTMTRNEIDSQAEALRFLQNSYLSEKELIPEQQQYRDIWNYVTSLAVSGADIDKLPANFDFIDSRYTGCDAFYNTDNEYNIYSNTFNAFVVNTRKIDPGDIGGTIIVAKNSPDAFAPAPLNPRIIFRNNSSAVNDENSSLSEVNTVANAYDHVQRVEGIWVIAVRSNASTNRSASEYYDFHIRSCWYAPGQSNPSTIATIIRLYNPDFVK